MTESFPYNVMPYRCDSVCTRAMGMGRCLCPNHAGSVQVVAVEDARQRGGACGPEAEYLVLAS